MKTISLKKHKEIAEICKTLNCRLLEGEVKKC